MLYECNYPKLLFFKYGLVVFPLLPFLGLAAELTQDQSWPHVFGAILIPLAFGVCLYIGTSGFRNRFKYVAIGKDKIIVKKKNGEVEYNWLDVERISLIRVWSLYELKLKGEEKFYFTAYGDTSFTGDLSDMGVIINKMKRELGI
jgi:hypothetical protein